MNSPDPTGSAVRRILAVKQSSFGDIVHATPCFKALRKAYPGAEILLAVEQRWRGVVASDPHLDGLVEIPTHMSLTPAFVVDARRALRASGSGRFDVAIDLQGTRRSAACVYLSRARVRFGRGGFRPGWRPVVRPAQGRHAVLVCADICRAGGVPVDDLEPGLYTAPRDELAVDAFLDAAALPREGFVLVNPTSRWRSKDIPDATTIDLLAALGRESGAQVLVTGGVAEQKRCESLARAAGSARIASIAGRLPLAHALCVFRRARLMVSCDSGPMHAAAALGTQVVAVFGPTLPECSGPWGAGHVVVQASRPPTQQTYRADAEGRYMAANTAGRIMDAVRMVLDARAASPPPQTR